MKYTEEQLQFIKEEYLEDSSRDNLKFLADKYDTTIRSIVGQLTKMGIYKKLTYTTKNGERPVSKNEIVELIADKLNTSSDILDGLDKCPKPVLRLILRGLDKNADKYFAPG